MPRVVRRSPVTSSRALSVVETRPAPPTYDSGLIDIGVGPFGAITPLTIKVRKVTICNKTGFQRLVFLTNAANTRAVYYGFPLQPNMTQQLDLDGGEMVGLSGGCGFAGAVDIQITGDL